MAAIVARPAAIADVYALARALRPGDRAEVEAMGKTPRHALRYCFRHSLYPAQVCTVDGEVAAMWGLSGDVLSDMGEPWLLTGMAVERVPVSFIKIARAWVTDALAVKPKLEGYTLAEYVKAVRLLEGLGFRLDPPAPLGPRQALFRRFWIEA